MNTLTITNQLQQRTDSAAFRVFQGTAPAENQDVKIYDGAIVASHSGTTIVLKDSYQVDVNAFRVGQVIWLDILDGAPEKGIVASYDEDTRTIELEEAPDVSMDENDAIGELIFGGVVARVQDMNVQNLNNIEYSVTCVDYTKIFDKKVISDTWVDVDARYIINSFVNSTVNYNSDVDNLSYENNTAIQAEYTESGDGDAPTVDTINYMEGDTGAVFSWTNSGGDADWVGSPVSKNVSQFTGVSSGQPTAGDLMVWLQTTDQAIITTFAIDIGSDASNYLRIEFDLTDSADFQYMAKKLSTGSITGTPDWTALDYVNVHVEQTGSGQVILNGIRINANNSFTLYNVEPTTLFTDIRSPQLKPTAFINQLANALENVWYISYERDIYFKETTSTDAPYSVTDTSDNFTDLKIEADVSNIGNRIIVRGGEKTSTSLYAQVEIGDNAKREWKMKSKFKNLTISIDNNTSTDTMEGGTTTTNVVATAHGLETGDHIINRSRVDADGLPYVRQITKVDDDNFTVQAVPSQTSGDTFSKFADVATVGIEGITDETTVDYVGNSNEASVRATSLSDTLVSGEYIRFSYNERLQIQLQYTDSSSANALKALGFGDGIFDLDPITDRNIIDTNTALTLAEAQVNQFSNAIITGTFTTDQKGLRSSQLLQITESIGRTIDDTYVIQIVRMRQKEGRFKDYFEINVTFGTTLFGWIEFMQKLLRTKDSIELNVDDIVETFATSQEIVESAETNTVSAGGINTVTGDEVVEAAETNQVVEFTPPWKWEPNGVGQPLNTRWNLFSWS